MASPDLDEPADRESDASDEATGSPVSSGCAEGLGLLVWLGQLARDESARRPSRSGAAELLDVPRSIGRFRLEALLGAGAYGAVFRALDTQLGRRVALKLAWPGVLMDPVASRRFIEEPKTVASLKHRGIVEVFESGEIEMAAFIALELVDGPTLAQWLKEQEHVSPRLAAQIVRCVAEAIHFAHERDIVHRDLKPGNILLRPSKNRDTFGYEPVVTDFGLARRPRLSEVSILTGTQAIIGTDQYMAPEQAAGRQIDVGPASDIFSLGVILYELVAGRRPFDGESSEQVRQRIQEDEAAPIRPWRKSVPKDLETITLKCLEKAPISRYVSAQELADDLGRFLDSKPIVARPVGGLQRAWKFTKRKPLAVSLAALAVVSALAITGLTGAWVADRMNSARRVKAAEAAASESESVEREHRYVANIRHAAEALRKGDRRNVIELLRECRDLAREPVHCSIEWNYLWSQANDFDKTLEVHSGDVYSIRFSPRGDAMVSAGKDGQAIVWDTRNWSKKQEFNDQMGEVNAAEFSADGSLLALAGDDGRLVVHRLDDEAIVYDERVVERRIFDLIRLGDGLQFAVGGDDMVLSVIDPIGGDRRRSGPLRPAESIADDYRAEPTRIAALAYLPERNVIAVAMKPMGVHVVDADSLKVVGPSIVEPQSVTAMCHIPSGPGFLAGAVDGSIRIWNSIDGSKIIDMGGLPGRIYSLRFSRRSGTLIASFRDGSVQTWDIENVLTNHQAVGRRFLAHDGAAETAESSADATWLASGGQDGRIRLWRGRSLHDSFRMRLRGLPWVTAFSPCGRWLAVVEAPEGETSLQVKMFDTRTGAALWTSPGPDSKFLPPVMFCAFDPTGEEVAFLDADFSIRGHDSKTGRVIRTYPLPAREPYKRLQFSPDGKRLMVGGRIDGTYILDRTSGQVVEHFPDSAPWWVGVFRTRLGDLWLRDRGELSKTMNGPALATLGGLADVILTATVSRSGRYFAAAGRDGVIYCWDLDRSRTPRKCVGHEQEIVDICFSPDEQTIVSRSYDGTARLWNVPTCSELVRFGSAENRIYSMALNPEGSMLVLGSRRPDLHGRYGLHVYRLGPNRESLPRTFEFPPVDDR